MSQAGGSGWHLELGVEGKTRVDSDPCGLGLEWLQLLSFVEIDITGGVGWS